jgi:hypothetical protein
VKIFLWACNDEVKFSELSQKLTVHSDVSVFFNRREKSFKRFISGCGVSSEYHLIESGKSRLNVIFYEPWPNKWQKKVKLPREVQTPPLWFTSKNEGQALAKAVIARFLSHFFEAEVNSS